MHIFVFQIDVLTESSISHLVKMTRDFSMVFYKVCSVVEHSLSLDYWYIVPNWCQLRKDITVEGSFVQVGVILLSVIAYRILVVIHTPLINRSLAKHRGCAYIRMCFPIALQ